MRPTGFAYNPARQILAWTEGSSSTSVYLASLAVPGRRIVLKSDVSGLIPFRFSKNGDYLAASTKGDQWGLTMDDGSMRVWNLETGQIMASINGLIGDATFAPDRAMLFVAVARDKDHEIGFYDLARPDREPKRFAGRNYSGSGALAVSPDGELVASASDNGSVRLFSPAKGELIESVQGHLNGAHGVAFSPDGRRLISTSGGREAVKLWDVGTRQELLTLGGSGSILNAANWSADGNVILAGPRWQAWWAPSWEEIAAAEAKEKAESKQP